MEQGKPVPPSAKVNGVNQKPGHKDSNRQKKEQVHANAATARYFSESSAVKVAQVNIRPSGCTLMPRGRALHSHARSIGIRATLNISIVIWIHYASTSTRYGWKSNAWPSLTDLHQWGLVNFDCSTLWIRDRRRLTEALDITPEFLRNKHSEEGQSIQKAIFRSRVEFDVWE